MRHFKLNISPPVLLTFIRTFWLDFKFLCKCDNQLKGDFQDKLMWQKALKLIWVEEKKLEETHVSL